MTSLAFWLLLAAFLVGVYATCQFGLLLWREALTAYREARAEQRDIEAWRLRVARRRMREVDDAIRQAWRHR